MKREPDRQIDPVELEASLRRLGVRELDERLELSPLLMDPGIEGTDRCDCNCSCDIVPDDPPEMDLPPMPGADGGGIYLGPR